MAVAQRRTDTASMWGEKNKEWTTIGQKNENAPYWRKTVSDDINEQSSRLTDWSQEYNQCSSGRFKGQVDECFLDNIQLINEYTSQALYQHCRVWPNAFWIGIPDNRQQFRIDGQGVEQEDLLCRHGGTDFDLVTPAECNIISIVVPNETLFGLAEHQGIRLALEDSCDTPRLRSNPQQIQSLAQLARKILGASDSPLDVAVHKDLLLQQVLSLLDDAEPNGQVIPSHKHRKAVVDRVRQHLDSAGDLPVTMTALCELTNVSRRTLQYSFESILGISPLQFLRTTRLNRVRRKLLTTRGISIADAAASQGFYHQSQFTADYKRLFGERPSETLKRVYH